MLSGHVRLLVDSTKKEIGRRRRQMGREGVMQPGAARDTEAGEQTDATVEPWFKLPLVTLPKNEISILGIYSTRRIKNNCTYAFEGGMFPHTLCNVWHVFEAELPSRSGSRLSVGLLLHEISSHWLTDYLIIIIAAPAHLSLLIVDDEIGTLVIKKYFSSFTRRYTQIFQDYYH